MNQPTAKPSLHVSLKVVMHGGERVALDLVCASGQAACELADRLYPNAAYVSLIIKRRKGAAC